MTLELLLTDLSRLGIKLQASGGQLSISAPKGSLTVQLRDAIARHKTDILAHLGTRITKTAGATLPVIVPEPDKWNEPFPFSDLQVGFYLGSSESMEYHVRPHYYLELDYAELDVERYERAWNRALQRHRASIPVVTDDLELQIVRELPPLRFPVSDLRGRPAHEAEAEIAATRQRMERAELPLERWPWFDWHITLYDAGRARVHFNSNNFFSDGYGTQKLLALVDRLYQQPDLELPPLELGYRDCVLALQRLEESEIGQRSLAYWRERLPHLPKPPPLPQVPHVNPVCRSRLVRRSRVLPARDWRGFKAQAARYGLTPTNAVYAVYAEVLAQWSGSRHFVVNNMVTHRFPMHPQMKEVLGNFASLYPLEVDWRGELPFATRARNLQQRLFQDIEHVYCSSMRVLQELNRLQGTPGRAPCPHVVGSGLFMESWEVHEYSCLETSQTQLDHQFWELDDERYYVVWDLLEEFFPEGLIDAMWDAYLALIVRLAHEPQAWEAVRLVGLPAEQQDRRLALADGGVPMAETSLAELLVWAAAEHPDHAAIVSPQRTLTYGELDRFANRIGRRLRVLGAEPNRLVAIVMDKGWEQVVAAAGILAAGAAYVPIDPGMPRERLHYLLANAEVTLVLTQRHVDAALVWPEGVQRLIVEDGEFADVDASGLASGSKPGDLAYVIYTSGSTGEPKGVMIDHRGVLNTVLDINRRFGVGPQDRLFGISSLSFDLSVYDIFGAFAAAATLVLPDRSATRDPLRWRELLVRERVTVWNSAPALMQLLVDAVPADADLPDLRLVMLSGDWIPVALPERIRSLAPTARVVSLGGATEASIWSIYYVVDQVDPAWPSIPYGKPLANQRWQVLDEQNRPCPDWVTGDLYIAGTGLALGYWRDPEKTARSFIVDDHTGQRLYRTGDLGRYLPDGNIEFLGRRDFQVKIQGYRIELGEIETVLGRHPKVKDAVVVARDDGRGGKSLLAYVVGAGIDTHGLQEYLRAWLPEYMVPGTVLFLPALPLTSNGKVDRKALPVPQVQTESDTAGRPRQDPRDDVERELAAIWQQLLGVERVGTNDDFFELGGQSFTAIRMLARVAHRLGRSLPLAAVLEGRTIERIAQRLRDAGEGQSSWSPRVQLRAGAGTPWFLVHPAGGSVLGYRELARQLPAPLYGLQAVGLHGEAEPLADVASMARLYLEAVREAQEHGPYTVGGWSSGGAIAFEMARQLEASGERVERVILIDSPAPLQHGPVDEVTLLAWFLEDLHIGFPLDRLDRAALRDLPPATLLDHALRVAPELADGLDSTELAPIWAVFRATILAGRCYRAGTIRAPLWVLRATERVVSEFADHPADAEDDWGWGRYTLGGTRCTPIPGDHHTILQPPNVAHLVQGLRGLTQAPAAIAEEAGA